MTDRIPADVNPYQTPASLSLGDSTSADELDDPRLARRLTRLAAVMIDWVFVELGVGSGMLTNLALGLVFDHPVGLLVGVGGMLAVEAWLIATRGQSIGKVLFRIRVVSDAHGRTPDVFYGLFVRYGLWFVPGFVYLDGWFIFGRRRKCLHDYAAGTRVVLVDPPDPASDAPR